MCPAIKSRFNGKASEKKKLEALLRAFEEKLCMLGAARDTPTKENSHTLTEDFIHLWY